VLAACAKRKKVGERGEWWRREQLPFKAVRRRWGMGQGKARCGGKEWGVPRGSRRRHLAGRGPGAAVAGERRVQRAAREHAVQTGEGGG
jgi:hypothetical protein